MDGFDDVKTLTYLAVMALPACGALASRHLPASLLASVLCAAALAAGEHEWTYGLALWALAWLAAYAPTRAAERREALERRRWRRILAGTWHHWRRNLPDGAPG